MNKNIPLLSIVVPKEHRKDWTIGKVIGMSRFDLSIGPLLHIRDIATGILVQEFPHMVDRLVRE
jgi:hypothetical protein